MLAPLLLLAASLDGPALERELHSLTQGFAGRVGACVTDGRHLACVRGEERFPLQSVMKLPLSMAVLNAVDRQGWKLDEPVTVRKQDLSVYHQPLALHVGPDGFATTLGDLVRRAIIESDNAACDFLIAKLGGPQVVHRFVTRHGIRNMRIDRDERHLQTDIDGIHWRPEFTDAAVFRAAVAALPESVRTEAFQRNQKDDRDTAAPKAAVDMLMRLQRGELLSKTSTAFILQAMSDCTTGPNRLRAGVAAGWKLGHKTGSGGTWKGVTAAANDIGILTTPDGKPMAIAVFVADASADEQTRDALIARISAAVSRHYH